MLSSVRRMWMGALASLALLGASPARAEGLPEEVDVTHEELPEEMGLIGVATVQVGPGAPWVLPRFEPTGEAGFRAAGEVVLVETFGLGGWTLEEEALRRYPVVARQGRFLLLVIDVRSGEQAWLREQPESGPQPSVIFESSDAEGLGGSGFELEASRTP